MLSVRLPDELEDKINMLSERENTTKSDIVKKALEKYINDKEKQAHPYELGKELFGKYGSGEKDLSVRYKKEVRKKLMKKHLIDSGPLIALFDKDDKYHEPIKEYLKTYNGILYTTWPVITEVLHMLDFNARVQVDFLKWIKLGGVDVVQLDQDIMSRIIELSEKYSDVPMNFADTTLIVTSEIIEIEKIISIDSDFYIYKNIRDKYLKNEFLVE